MVRLSTDERKQQISQAALKIIAEQGLGKFTTSAIAKEVGLSDGALFRHFSSKEEIVLAAIGIIEEKFFMDSSPEIGDPLTKLGAVISHRLAILSKHPHFAPLIFSDQLVQASGEEGVRRVQEMQARTIQFIHTCLIDAKKQGLLRKEIPIIDLTIIIIGSVLGAVNGKHFKSILPESDIGNIADNLWQTLENLIRR